MYSKFILTTILFLLTPIFTFSDIIVNKPSGALRTYHADPVSHLIWLSERSHARTAAFEARSSRLQLFLGKPSSCRSFHYSLAERLNLDELLSARDSYSAAVQMGWKSQAERKKEYEKLFASHGDKLPLFDQIDEALENAHWTISSNDTLADHGVTDPQFSGLNLAQFIESIYMTNAEAVPSTFSFSIDREFPGLHNFLSAYPLSSEPEHFIVLRQTYGEQNRVGEREPLESSVSYYTPLGTIDFENKTTEFVNSSSPRAVAANGPNSFVIAARDREKRGILRRFERTDRQLEVKNYRLEEIPELYTVQSSRYHRFLVCGSDPKSVWVAETDDQGHVDKKLEVYSGVPVKDFDPSTSIAATWLSDDSVIVMMSRHEHFESCTRIARVDKQFNEVLWAKKVCKEGSAVVISDLVATDEGFAIAGHTTLSVFDKTNFHRPQRHSTFLAAFDRDGKELGKYESREARAWPWMGYSSIIYQPKIKRLIATGSYPHSALVDIFDLNARLLIHGLSSERADTTFTSIKAIPNSNQVLLSGSTGHRTTKFMEHEAAFTTLEIPDK